MVQMETNANKPLKRCRKNTYRRRQNFGSNPILGKAQGIPVYCLSGVRHKSGVTLDRALVQNVGTCRPDVKGEVQAEAP
jgi:hypothetical protein